MKPTGLKPHTHADRQRMIDELVPLFEQRFGARLVAIAAGASFARGTDSLYSDLEMYVFLIDPPAEGEDHYLQRIVDGHLVEIIYTTAEAFLAERTKLDWNWHIMASEKIVPMTNPEFVNSLVAKWQAIQFSQQEFDRVAAQHIYPTQEAFAKALNACEQHNHEGFALVSWDVAMHLLITLSFLNRTPFTTFARFITEARSFTVKPDRMDEFLDIMVNGTYQDLNAMILLEMFASLEAIFANHGIQLYDQSLDPNQPNRKY
jgi:hypothetical protein